MKVWNYLGSGVANFAGIYALAYSIYKTGGIIWLSAIIVAISFTIAMGVMVLKKEDLPHVRIEKRR